MPTIVIQPHAPGLYEWLTLSAILVGPLVGIWVTRLIDAARETNKRRWELFVTLRRTRGLELSADHVAAINMVPVLFAKEPAVMRGWEELMDVLNDQSWNSLDEAVKLGVVERSVAKRVNLVNAVAHAVKATLPTKEEHRLGYAPIAWSNDQNQIIEARGQLLKVLKGQQVLHMTAGVYQLSPLDGGAVQTPSPHEEIEGATSSVE